jgi:hypothetical protein
LQTHSLLRVKILIFSPPVTDFGKGKVLERGSEVFVLETPSVTISSRINNANGLWLGTLVYLQYTSLYIGNFCFGPIFDTKLPFSAPMGIIRPSLSAWLCEGIELPWDYEIWVQCRRQIDDSFYANWVLFIG